MKYIMLTISLFLLANYSVLFSHGTKFKILQKGVVAIHATYHNNMPMKNARAEIVHSAQKNKIKITTDANGYAYFIPSASGKWNIKVYDATGHGFTTSVTIDKQKRLFKENNAHHEHDDHDDHHEIWERVRMFFCIGALAWGFIGTALYFKRKGNS